MLNYAKRRSLSGQRAFLQGGKHRPDRGAKSFALIPPQKISREEKEAERQKNLRVRQVFWLK